MKISNKAGTNNLIYQRTSFFFLRQKSKITVQSESAGRTIAAGIMAIGRFYIILYFVQSASGDIRIMVRENKIKFLEEFFPHPPLCSEIRVPNHYKNTLVIVMQKYGQRRETESNEVKIVLYSIIY